MLHLGSCGDESERSTSDPKISGSVSTKTLNPTLLVVMSCQQCVNVCVNGTVGEASRTVVKSCINTFIKSIVFSYLALLNISFLFLAVTYFSSVLGHFSFTIFDHYHKIFA